MATLPIAASRPGICSSLCGHRASVHVSKLCSPREAKSAVELVMFSVLHSHVLHGISWDMVGHGASAAKVLDRPLCQEVVVCAIHLGDFDVEQF